MNRLITGISGFSGAATRIGGAATKMLQDRLELLALELREAKIRFVQALILVCLGVTFSLLGLVLLVLTGLSELPPEWRVYGLAGAALVSLVAGAAALLSLRRVLGQSPLAFDQSVAELKKDATCFLTKN
ncbi:MAG: phage holin family protein [Clostridia bacterium]|nr:phage holin family protein [Clostridia bacterium]